jgi:hypothetical protein
MKKMIFGKCYQFECAKEFVDLLAESLELYPDAAIDSAVDMDIYIEHKLPNNRALSINPKVHQKFQNGMLTAYGNAEILWSKPPSCPLQAVLVFKKSPRLWKRVILKQLSMEYSREVEVFEQILHELVFIPSVYFFDDLAPVHSAAVSICDKSVLLAGTGGVGKSSALLALRQNEHVGFISDDIVILAADGSVFGNMAWPKIYGYNCVGSNLKAEILEGRGLADRLHFEIKNKLNPAHVRRKMKPNQLFNIVKTGATQLSHLYYVVREDVSEISISELSLDTAVRMTANVMNSEYAHFHNHLYWEEYNAQALGKSAMLTMDEVTSNWDAVYTSGLSSVIRYKVSIPLDIDHVYYQHRIVDIVTKNY